jgi:hypothetical protein
VTKYRDLADAVEQLVIQSTEGQQQSEEKAAQVSLIFEDGLTRVGDAIQQVGDLLNRDETAQGKKLSLWLHITSADMM